MGASQTGTLRLDALQVYLTNRQGGQIDLPQFSPKKSQQVGNVAWTIPLLLEWKFAQCVQEINQASLGSSPTSEPRNQLI